MLCMAFSKGLAVSHEHLLRSSGAPHILPSLPQTLKGKPLQTRPSARASRLFQSSCARHRPSTCTCTCLPRISRSPPRASPAAAACDDAHSHHHSHSQSGGGGGGRPPSLVAVFVSGGGSNLRAVHSAMADGRINGQVAVVVSDKPGCGGSEYARANGIPVLAYPRSAKFAPDGLTAQDLVAQLRAMGVELVLLAGYLKLLPEELVRAYPRAVLNIHPALLPAFGGKGFYGMKVHEAVIRSGARVSGPTVHFVNELFDDGPIVAQAAIPVHHTDTARDLQAKVLREEHKLYPHVVAALCDGRVQWRDDGVPYIIENKKGQC